MSSPKRVYVNMFSNNYNGDSLPGFSWIAFFFPWFCASQIRKWGLFWITGFEEFFLRIIENLLDIEFSASSFIGINLIYAYNYPYQRWAFEKNKHKETGKFKSILIGIFLSIIITIPSLIVDVAFGK